MQRKHMNNNSLLIVFVRNIILGKVKTRLAQTIGNENAFLIYKKLVEITEQETQQLNNCDIHIYFSGHLMGEQWSDYKKFVQQGNDLGEKMKNAFKDGFNSEYDKVILIGSDLPDISAKIIQQGFDELVNNDLVFGPAVDGGYYLIGMNKLEFCVFEDKPWSTENLLQITLSELKDKKVSLLAELNDIDIYEDLQKYPSLLKIIN